jgi:FKBP-type peptidyl-prolyl cis-trans isomerase (trigger factor)
MKLQQHTSDDGFHCLEVSADWLEMADDYNDILAGYRKVRLAGFRPGKVPQSVIEKRFQKEISAQLTQQVSQRLGRKAVQEAGIEVLGQAEVEEIECGKGRDFSARVRFYPMPEFDLPDLNTLLNGESDKDPRDRISLRLLELVSFDIPDGFVKDELALAGEESIDPGNAKWQSARDRIRLMLILKKIAKQEGIEVDQRDVNNRIAEKAEEFGATIKELKAELALGDGLQRLKEMLLAESVLGYLMEINTTGGNYEKEI